MPKAVWITGASSGIGRACAEVYASQGARVILSSRRKDVLEEVASKLTLQLGLKGDSNFVIAPMDLGDSAAMSGIVNGVLAEVKEVDIMIHCGGISQRSLAIDTSLEVDRRVMEAKGTPTNWRLYYNEETDRLILPWVRNNEIVYYQERAIRHWQPEKYRFPSEMKKDIFGIDNIDESWKYILFTEGCFDSVFIFVLKPPNKFDRIIN